LSFVGILSNLFQVSFNFLFLSILLFHKYDDERGMPLVKKWNQRIRPWQIKYLALPSDVILELPRITMIGQIHAYIENHQGIATYSDTELKLKTYNQLSQITRVSIVLKMMLPDEILLEGTITDIKFIPHS